MNADEIRRRWAGRSGEFSPRYYAYYGPNETSELLLEVLNDHVGTDAAVLEVGCSSGRHLARLHEHGYRNLHGIDINADAFRVMAETYPDLAADGTFYRGAIEECVPEFADGRFDAVYSVETLQHLHPDDEWVFEELARVASTLLVTVESEDGGEDEHGKSGDDRPETSDTAVTYVDDDIPLYHRRWRQVFTGLGFVEVDVRPTKRDTLRAFRREGRPEGGETES